VVEDTDIEIDHKQIGCDTTNWIWLIYFYSSRVLCL